METNIAQLINYLFSDKLFHMTMATDQKLDGRNNKVPLRKQSEIEEEEDQETSPGSDQSDSTITTGKFVKHFISV